MARKGRRKGVIPGETERLLRLLRSKLFEITRPEARPGSARAGGPFRRARERERRRRQIAAGTLQARPGVQGKG